MKRKRLPAGRALFRSVVALRIEEIRKTRGLSCEQLAARLAANASIGVHWDRVKVWRHETGRLGIDSDDASAYAEALGVSVASLYREARAS